MALPESVGTLGVVIPVTAVAISLVTLLMSWFSLHQKAEDRELVLLNATVQARIAGLEREIDLTRRQLAELQALDAECQRERQKLQVDNFDLMRRVLRLENGFGSGPRVSG